MSRRPELGMQWRPTAAPDLVFEVIAIDNLNDPATVISKCPPGHPVEELVMRIASWDARFDAGELEIIEDS